MLLCVQEVSMLRQCELPRRRQHKQVRTILLKTQSQVDHSSIVVEELATVARNLHGNAVRVFDVPLPQLLEHAAETVVPSLLFLGGLAWVCGAELHE
jgi:hypothetical protein